MAVLLLPVVFRVSVRTPAAVLLLPWYCFRAREAGSGVVLPIVLLKSALTGGGVAAAGGVGDERLKTGGRVPAAGGIVTERIKPNSGIALATCQAKKRKIPLGGV